MRTENMQELYAQIICAMGKVDDNLDH